MESFDLGPAVLLPGGHRKLGAPVVAVSVVSHRINEQDELSGGPRFETDDRGIYRMYGLPAGKYLVSVYDSGRFSSGSGQTIYPDAKDQTRATVVTVTAGAESTGIDIRLGHPQQTYRITGRLIAQDTGKPVAGASIGIRGSNIDGSVSTDSDGVFKIDDCVPGNYEVKIATTGGPTQGYYSDPLAIQVTDADLTWNSNDSGVASAYCDYFGGKGPVNHKGLSSIVDVGY